MAAPKKKTLPSNERDKLQAYFRAFLIEVGISQAELARSWAALQKIESKFRRDQEWERERLASKAHDFIRTHLKAGDQHFTYEAADRILEMIWDIYIDWVRQNPGFGIPDFDEGLWEGVFAAAPSLQQWMLSNKPRALIPISEAPRLAEVIAETLLQHRIIKKPARAQVKAMLTQKLRDDCMSWAWQFASEWGRRTDWYKIEDGTPSDMLFRLANIACAPR
jgi:hypothetical protein